MQSLGERIHLPTKEVNLTVFFRNAQSGILPFCAGRLPKLLVNPRVGW